MRHTVLAFFMLLPLGVAAALLVWSHKRRVHLQDLPTGHTMRSANLTKATRNHDRSRLVVTGLAILPLAGVALSLVARWNDIPARFPIHWGIDGRPNGWSARSPLSVFGPLTMGTVLIGLFLLMDVLTERYSPGFQGRPAMLRVKSGAFTGAAWLISLLFCAVSGFPLLKDPTRWIPLFVAGCVVGSLVLVAVVVYRSMQLPEAVVAASHQTTEERFWKGGLIYYNPSDSAMMVPKRDGLGYTMNFGKPVAWVLLIGILLVALGLPLAFHILHRR